MWWCCSTRSSKPRTSSVKVIDPSVAWRRNAGSTWKVTATSTPIAPSPTRAASKRSGSLCASTVVTAPSEVTSSSRATCEESEAQRPPEPCVPVEMAPATLCRSMSPRLFSASPSPSSWELSRCRGVPASTVAVIADRSTLRMPTNRSGRSIRPSVTAMSLKEWPVPTILTRRPCRRAASTASTTWSGLVGESTCAGRA